MTFFFLFNMLCQCKNTTKQYYFDAKHSQQDNGVHNLATQCNMTLCWRGQQPILFHPTTQSTVSTNRTAWVNTGTVMLLQYRTETHHALFTFLAKCVTHVVYWPMLLSAYLNVAVRLMTVQSEHTERAGTDLWTRRGRLWWAVHSRRSWSAVCSNKTPSGPRAGSSQRSMPSHQFPPASLTKTHSLPLCRTSPVSLPISVFPFLPCSLFLSTS